ncbi:Fic family protein [Roseateles sp. DC23W]|uniref:Fic family protein n=1 Tax=Pelomonas dachongensis TaxID=3299029 RepID=A0ABW7EP81_9BURK
MSTNTAVQVCRSIQGVDMDIRRTPGTTLTNDRTGQVIYTPPEGEALLREKLATWERWMHGTLPGSEHVDSLVRMAASHYQFEAIHPFTEGNGRTGRVLNLLYLVEQGLLDIPVLYPEPAHPAQQGRLLQRGAGGHHNGRLAALAAVHAQRRDRDRDVNHEQGGGVAAPAERNRRTHAQGRQPDLFTRAG